MLLSHSKKFIFIHNYKVAGSSISTVLSRYTDDVRQPNLLERAGILLKMFPKHYPSRYPWHITAKELKHKLKGTTMFDQYFKFGFVRNPWDWQVSLYTFMLKNRMHHQHKMIKAMKDFDHYIEWRVNEDFHLQKEAFYDDENNCLVDFVGKIENINTDFDFICGKLGIQEELPHTNKSRADNNFLKYYSQKSLEIVYKAFYDDVVTFGYEKPVLRDSREVIMA